MRDFKEKTSARKKVRGATRPTLIGYQRVYTDDQELELQRDALTAAGVRPNQLYEDKLSGAKTDRPGLEHAIRACREGDILVVWRLDRLGRSLKDLINIVDRLQGHGVGLRSLHENIDTTTASGRLCQFVRDTFSDSREDATSERIPCKRWILWRPEQESNLRPTA